MEVDSGDTHQASRRFPVLIDCSLKKKCTFKTKISAMAPPTKEGPAIFKVARTTHKGNIACNEI